MTSKPAIIIALPKGRIAEELVPVLKRMDLAPEPAYFDPNTRQLMFATHRSDVALIRVRSFDVPTFVAFGAAHIGVAGSDVLAEFNYPDLYVPLDLKIGQCRMSVAAPEAYASDEEFKRASHIRIATKYANITQKYFAEKGVQAECIKLNGAMELAPTLGLCRRIVDLVSSGATLKANGLVELEKIMDVSSRLIVNRGAYKTRNAEITALIEAFQRGIYSHG